MEKTARPVDIFRTETERSIITVGMIRKECVPHSPVAIVMPTKLVPAALRLLRVLVSPVGHSMGAFSSVGITMRCANYPKAAKFCCAFSPTKALTTSSTYRALLSLSCSEAV